MSASPYPPLADHDETLRLLYEHAEELQAERGTGEWPDPQPMTTTTTAEPYPLDALPATIQAAVRDVQGFVQAPVAMVATCALTAVSAAVQAYVDVRRARSLTGPVSLFALTIAESGERKTSIDRYFTRAIRAWQAEIAEEMRPKVAAQKAAIGAWDAERDGLLQAIRQAGKTGKPTDDHKASLAEIEQEKPDPLRVPHVLLGDETPEALAWSMAHKWPAAAILSSEAGAIFGAHGMGRDSVMRNLALQNTLWDGGEHSIGRRTSESFTVRGARLTLGLQIQEATIREFFERAGVLARGSGFLARFLFCWPESTQGCRTFREAPATWPGLDRFDRRLRQILEEPVPMNDQGELEPAVLGMTPDARDIWIGFHDTIERQLSDGGKLRDVRDVAAKVADNAARVAALFHALECGTDGEIDARTIEGATWVTAWHLDESQRFFGELALPEELADATRLDAWLIAHCHRERVQMVSTREAQRFGPVRKRERLDEALRVLAELDRARVRTNGKRREIILNPALRAHA